MIERRTVESLGIRAEHMQAHISEQLHDFWSTKSASFKQMRLAMRFPRKRFTGNKVLKEIENSAQSIDDIKQVAAELLDGKEDSELAKTALRYGQELLKRTGLSADILKFDKDGELTDDDLKIHQVGEFIAATRFLVRGLYGKDIANNEPLIAIAFDKAADGVEADFTAHAAAGLMLLTIAEIDPVIHPMEAEI